MKLVFTISSALLLISGCYCKKPERGFEIYLVDITYPDFTVEKELESLYCFIPEKSDLFDKPILIEKDIEYFDWENQVLVLNDSGKEKLSNLEIPLQGLAASVVLDGIPIYGFWFWNIVSSFGCDWVYTYARDNLELKFGLPNGFGKGMDPRRSRTLGDYVIKEMNRN